MGRLPKHKLGIKKRKIRSSIVIETIDCETNDKQQDQPKSAKDNITYNTSSDMKHTTIDNLDISQVDVSKNQSILESMKYKKLEVVLARKDVKPVHSKIKVGSKILLKNNKIVRLKSSVKNIPKGSNRGDGIDGNSSTNVTDNPAIKSNTLSVLSADILNTPVTNAKNLQVSNKTKGKRTKLKNQQSSKQKEIVSSTENKIENF